MEASTPPPSGGADHWYIGADGEQRGPVTRDALGALARSRALTPATLIWHPGLADWQPAADSPGLFSPVPLTTGAAPTGPRASYFVRHWRGELSLPVSYWLNGMISGIAVPLLALAIGALIKPAENQVLAAIGVTAIWLFVAAATVWQMVGVWRSAGKHKSRGGRGFWAGTARVMVVLGFVGLANSLITQAAPSTIEYWRIAMGDPTLGPHELRLLRGGTELEYSGTITFGATDEVRKMLDANPAIRVIHLNSRGGRIAEARKLRDLIHERNLTTYTSSGCASACTLAFMGGTRRLIPDKPLLGFHRGAFPGLSDLDLAGENSADRRWLIDHGVATWFADHAYATPNTTLWRPTVDELRRANVITGIASPADFALSGTEAAGFGDREHADQTLLKLPLYSAIRAADPDAYAEIRDATVAAIRDGRSQSELAGLARPYLGKLIKASLPYASDAAIVEATRVMVAELDQIGEKNPADCYIFAFAPPGAPPVIVQNYVTPETQARELASSTAVIQSAAHAPRGPVPGRAEIKDPMALVMQRMVAALGTADVGLMGHPDQLSAHPDKACMLVTAMFKEILALPPATEVEVLRSLYAQPR